MRVLAAVLVLFVPRVTQAEAFNPGCTLPFDAIKEAHALDQSCAAEGDATEEPHRAQNRAKNFFCAQGPAVRVTHFTLTKLEEAVDAAQPPIPHGTRANLPPDRDRLKHLWTTSDGHSVGEGDLVRLVGYLLEAHHAGAESVTCSLGGKDNTDIHIAISATKPTSEPAAVSNASECRSVTAEMSAHFRPTGWDLDQLDLVGDHPVRVTGQLFFDASHKPCNGTTPRQGHPKRVSDWEIHPVYAFDVCKNTSLSGCPFDNEAKWVPLHEWVGAEEHE